MADLMSVMEISRAQASKDINAYIADHPDHLFYDKSARTYVMGAAFTPHYMLIDPAEYLDRLAAVAKGAPTKNADWIVGQPDILSLALPSPGLSPEIVRTVIRACIQRQRLEIHYQSMSAAAAILREIEPHALAHDGFRWHARAFCLKDNVFKDFVLSRMIDATQSGGSESTPVEDHDWRETITLRISAHPDLPEGQRRIVELDYGMTDGIAELVVRKCMLYYNLKRLGLDTRPDTRAPQDQHIVLRNADEAFAVLGRKAP
ncbi:helix-turn-helix transcriptional regulator [Donghicola tyrosinivorans]|uniref:helix-turn-helix transcriptional regulator n=1 Tax=Donghicola tyrosinivorans TaxID=1652492 RepID=UPI00147497F0|nr:WYL domain-containing protein [Donghicola tyrosinivorans]